ncbi:MAG: argininosuccinate synthase [Alphaproteobacteria bacterium]|nr:argininosuccinate synthase [Alphaproteobacteria bacterium]MCB9693732.1 argininosuccinate synthase [Alphaproteobacteria bacterium]
MIPWLTERYDAEIITYTGDLGQGEDLPAIRQKALNTGASVAVVDDLQKRFVDEFVVPALKAGALYEGKYPLHTALGRPLLAQRLVEVALDHGADAIAHGCTGKGNDQVRFEVAAQCLAPHLKVIAPLREWDLTTRELEIDYALERNIPIPITKAKPYSIDRNIWGCAIECGEMEDLWQEPPADAWMMTSDPAEAPKGSIEMVIGFDKGVPVSIDGETLDTVHLIARLNQIAGAYGVGRIDMVENRVVGLKSREVYEGPAAVVLHMAHVELERIVLDRPTFQYKRKLALDFATLIYDGLWFGPLRHAMQAFIESTQQHLTGDVRVRISAGLAQITGRRSPFSLYDDGLATYSDGDTFDRTAAVGFLKLYGLSYQTWGRVQRTR